MDIIRELAEYEITPIVCDPVADADEARREYGITLCPLSDFKGLDAVVVAVAHDEFKKLSPAEIDGMFGEGHAKVLADVKGALNRRDYEQRGYLYWRL